MTRKKKITLIVVISLIVALLAAVLIYYFGETFPVYTNIRKSEFKIPGLKDGFVPQGFEYDENSNSYFISGYMADNSASRIYVLEQGKENCPKYVTITFDGQDLKGHFGGVTTNNDNVWVAGDGDVYRINKSNILNATCGDKIASIDHFKSGNGADSITIHNNHLWVGEFHLDEKYDTDTSHHIEVKAGETNKAVAYAFELSETGTYGIASTTPVFGLSLPDKAQGFTFTDDGKIVVSTSYSIPKSHIYVYENVLESANTTTATIDSHELTIYKCSSDNLVKDIVAPAMSEEVIFKDNRIFILYESACKKYNFVNRTRLTEVHSITIEE